MLSEGGEHECESVRGKKKLYRFRYGVRPREESQYERLLDYQAVDFDHRALAGEDRGHSAPTELAEEHVLFLIKPSAMVHKNEIRKRVYDEGYATLKEMTLWMTSEQMTEFYKVHYGKPWFPKFILNMLSGPTHIMVLSKYNAIEDMKILMGNKRVSIARREAPYSLRALYGLKGDSATNGVHSSSSYQEAMREIHFFFPQAIPEPMPDVLEYIDYIQDNMYNVTLKGIKELKAEKPDMPMAWLSNWFLNNNYDTPITEPEYIMQIPY